MRAALSQLSARLTFRNAKSEIDQFHCKLEVPHSSSFAYTMMSTDKTKTNSRTRQLSQLREILTKLGCRRRYRVHGGVFHVEQVLEFLGSSFPFFSLLKIEKCPPQQRGEIWKNEKIRDPNWGGRDLSWFERP